MQIERTEEMCKRIRTRKELSVLLHNVNHVAQHDLVMSNLAKCIVIILWNKTRNAEPADHSRREYPEIIIHVTFGSRTPLMVYILAIACRDSVRSGKRSQKIRVAAYAVTERENQARLDKKRQGLRCVVRPSRTIGYGCMTVNERCSTNEECPPFITDYE